MCFRNPKDWSKVEQAVTEELKQDKPEGEEALKKLFQDIYGQGDEDSRRAMYKSFIESNGTVLSTNWKEVQPHFALHRDACPPLQH